jgi:regulation of enolase protein 1 (concanavalin A-like superfamily)
MTPGRRAFLRTSLILGSAALLGKRVVAQASPTPAVQETELLARMSWMNEPASSKLSGTQLLVHSRPKTDFWRKTFFTSVRQGYFPPGIRVEVGVMCAAPEGPGFDAVFDSVPLENA